MVSVPFYLWERPRHFDLHLLDLKAARLLPQVRFPLLLHLPLRLLMITVQIQIYLWTLCRHLLDIDNVVVLRLLL